MSNAFSDACEVAKDRYYNCARWLNLWKVLLFSFGMTIVIFCILAIILFIHDSWLAGAISMLGTIANGIGIGWVVKQRDKASDEERDAFDVLNKTCSPPGKQLVGIRQQPWFLELQTSAWRSLFLSLPH